MSLSSVTHGGAEQALRQSSIPALRTLAVEVSDGTVVISGSVSSFYLKQLAQETIMPHVNGRSLVNRVSVELRNEIRHRNGIMD